MASAVVRLAPSTELTGSFNELLRQHKSNPTKGKVSLDLDVLEGFIKEAYRIVRHLSQVAYFASRGLFAPANISALRRTLTLPVCTKSSRM